MQTILLIGWIFRIMTKKSKLAFLFFLLFSAASIAANSLDRVLVIVNDSVITEIELEHRLQMVKKQLGPQTNIPEQALRSQLLDRLILDKIQHQIAERSGIQIDDVTLDQAVTNIMKDNKLSMTEFRARLTEEGVDYDTFREELRHDMMVSQLQKREIVPHITVSEQEIAHYLKSPEGSNNIAAEYHLKHILIALPSNPTPEQIHTTEREATKILQGLQQEGAAFNTMAIRYSQGQQALQGGDLGWRRLSELPTLFSDVILTLKPGQVAGLYRNASGFHIIQLVEKRQQYGEMIPLQSHVHQIFIKSLGLTDSSAAEQIKVVHALLKAGGSFAELAAEDPNSDLGWLAPEDVAPEFRHVMNGLIIGQASEPFETSDGWHIIKVLERKEVAPTEEFAKAKAFKIIQARKFEEKLNDWLRQIRAQAFVEMVSIEKNS